jgi:hypothetical protein
VILEIYCRLFGEMKCQVLQENCRRIEEKFLGIGEERCRRIVVEAVFMVN